MRTLGLVYPILEDLSRCIYLGIYICTTCYIDTDFYEHHCGHPISVLTVVPLPLQAKMQSQAQRRDETHPLRASTQLTQE